MESVELKVLRIGTDSTSAVHTSSVQFNDTFRSYLISLSLSQKMDLLFFPFLFKPALEILIFINQEQISLHEEIQKFS